MAAKKKTTDPKKPVTKKAVKKAVVEKKPIPVKKETSSTDRPTSTRTVSSESSTNKSFAIYNDPDLQKPLQSPGKDLIKILSKNPQEAFIFWNIMPGTYSKALDHFSKNAEEIGLELLLEYTSHTGHPHSQRVSIHPLSQNYFCRFPGPVSHLRVTIYAVNEGREYLIFNSQSVSLPANKPSDSWDGDWVNPEWIEKGYLVKDSQTGYYKLADGKSIQDAIHIPDGSSGFMGSSGFLGSSGKGGSSGFMGSSGNYPTRQSGSLFDQSHEKGSDV